MVILSRDFVRQSKSVHYVRIPHHQGHRQNVARFFAIRWPERPLARFPRESSFPSATASGTFLKAFLSSKIPPEWPTELCCVPYPTAQTLQHSSSVLLSKARVPILPYSGYQSIGVTWCSSHFNKSTERKGMLHFVLLPSER